MPFSSHLTAEKMAENRYNIDIRVLGKNVRRFRKRRGWTQVDLETNTGIPQGDVSRIENGLLDLHFSSIVRLAEALEVPTKDLLDIENSENTEG